MIVAGVDIDAVVARLRRFENAIPWMYRDSTHGAVTSAMGQVLLTAAHACSVEWHIGTRAATADEVSAEFAAVAAAPVGHPATFYAALTQCRLDDKEIVTLAESAVAARVEELAIVRRYPGWYGLPKPVLEALADMAYNLGVVGLIHDFPRMHQAIAARDWPVAAAESFRLKICRHANYGACQSDLHGDDRNQDIAALLRTAA